MSESEWLRHESCPSCGSHDNLGRYSDGHGFCFGCGYWEPGEGQKGEVKKAVEGQFIFGDYMPLIKRGINEETCRRFGYQIGSFENNGKRQPVQVANYYRDNHVVGQKVRFKDKNFLYLNDGSKPPLWGQHLWNGGKMVVVTEGEIDAMSVAQVQGLKWPVVSIPQGAKSARKAIQRELEWLEKFETVVLMFDMDEPGQSAARECAQVLQVGKAKIARLPLKDANEMLKAGRGAEIINAIWNAKPYRPDGIISGADSWEHFEKMQNVESIPYPWESINTKTRGMRPGEIITFTAGTGIGKSTMCREIAYYLLNINERVGYLALEESVGKTVQSLISIHLNIPLHLRPEDATPEQKRNAWEEVCNNDKLFLYDHWGSADMETLLSKMRFLVKGCGCRWLFLDHISIAVSGIAEGDERRLIDNMMTVFRKFVEETGCGLIIVSHLKRGEGNKGHEDGQQVHLSQLRGSQAIAQLSDIAMALERNQQSEEESDVSTVRVLKNRFSGDTGVAGHVQYIKETGRLIDIKVKDNGKKSKIFKDESEDY